MFVVIAHLATLIAPVTSLHGASSKRRGSVSRRFARSAREVSENFADDLRKYGMQITIDDTMMRRRLSPRGQLDSLSTRRRWRISFLTLTIAQTSGLQSSRVITDSIESLPVHPRSIAPMRSRSKAFGYFAIPPVTCYIYDPNDRA